MGELVPTGLDAPIKLARALEAGRHVAMLVDQHYVAGVDVTFFGRKCMANPLIAMLARQVGLRDSRHARDPAARWPLSRRSDTSPSSRRATPTASRHSGDDASISPTIVEGWVREYPEQWLWLHRRWR